jgi:hypothetical protein
VYTYDEPSPDNTAEASLVLDNAIWDSHLTAEGRQEQNQLNGIHIVGNKDQLGLLLLN